MAKFSKFQLKIKLSETQFSYRTFPKRIKTKEDAFKYFLFLLQSSEFSKIDFRELSLQTLSSGKVTSTFLLMSVLN